MLRSSLDPAAYYLTQARRHFARLGAAFGVMCLSVGVVALVAVANSGEEYWMFDPFIDLALLASAIFFMAMAIAAPLSLVMGIASLARYRLGKNDQD